MMKIRLSPIVGILSIWLITACVPFGASTGQSAAGPASKGAGSQAQAPATGRGPIKIGLLEELTGSLASQGKDNLDAFNLYLDSINRTVAGRGIEVVVADIQSQPDVGVTKARQLVENDKVHLLAGISSTAICYAVAPYVKDAQIPLAITGNCGAQDLMINPRFTSPYLTRFTQVLSGLTDTMADFAYQDGRRRAITIGSDYAGGTQTISGFQSAFIKRGGIIVQELYPALGTNDFGPFLAQLDPSADMIAVFLPGTDGLRFGEQFAVYGAQSKLPIYDIFGTVVHGANLAQLKDKAVGIIANSVYSSAYESPENKKLLDLWNAKFPGRFTSYDVGNGYAGAQVIAAAIEKINGNVEDKQALLNALYETNMMTAKGPVKLDEHHDVIQNIYVYRIDKSGDQYVQRLLKTYENVSITWDRTLDEVRSFPWGETKGRLVNVTKEQLPQVLAQMRR
ncbi:MAG TPA: ABC transporter substrate-binding protein [Chloroflexota bacterium]|nr:ABC transporter substrate-binding protein [Chloroflexota bacterium]